MIRIGSHISISDGIHHSYDRALALNLDVFQIFLKNNSTWESSPHPSNNVAQFREKKLANPSMHVFAHAGYLANPAGRSGNIRKTIDNLKDDILRARRLGVRYLVIHPGNHMGKGAESGIKRAAQTINEIQEKLKGDVTLLLETTSGQGTSIGHRFEHIQGIIELVEEKETIKVCFDTCHVFASGYDISTRSGFINVMKEFDSIIGVKKIKLIHLNDSKTPCGSMVDRHEHIGKGHIGLEGFKTILNYYKFKKVPFILETPKGHTDREDRENLATVFSLLKKD